VTCVQPAQHPQIILLRHAADVLPLPLLLLPMLLLLLLLLPACASGAAPLQPDHSRALPTARVF
jgi:hypothetical protein